MRAVVIMAVAIACQAGCGDSGGGAIDAGPLFDARRYFDASVIACSADAACPDGERTPVCDLDRGFCVECIGDDDCQGTGALGPSCNEQVGTCECTGDSDCQGNANGPRCHPITSACTCIDDGDCPEPSTCELEPYLGAGQRTCREL